jgi:hypothetical protein
MKILTAEEARKLSASPLEEKIESLSKTIERLAKEGKRSCRTGYDHKEDEELWIYGGYDTSNDWKTAKEILEINGYKVTFYYRELSFVDMYTLIEW